MSEHASRESVERSLDRIATVDLATNAVCTLHPDAKEHAARLDRETADGRSRGPLHGRAVLVKDNIDTHDLPTTAGSLALADAPPPERDAALVRRLRDAGLVILGKTNLSEWANIRDEASTSGWSAYGGLTRNPHALNRSAGGSSSGSGAAGASRRWRSGPRPTGRSPARPPSTAAWASSPPWAWCRPRGSSRSRGRRTRP